MSYETYILSQIRKSTSYQTKCRIIMRTSNTRCNLNCRISDNFSNDSFSTRVFLNRQIPNDRFSIRYFLNRHFLNTTVSQTDKISTDIITTMFSNDILPNDSFWISSNKTTVSQFFLNKTTISNFPSILIVQSINYEKIGKIQGQSRL